MKTLLFLLCVMICSCASNKNYLERSNGDKALQDAVKRLSKDPSDESATRAIPVLYTNISKAHLDKIKMYNSSQELSRWDKIITEYEYLQNAYDAIINSHVAFTLVNPESYTSNILEAKQLAAEEYYSYANSFFNKPGMDNAKNAYVNFNKAEQFVPGYKNAKANMNVA